MKKYLNRIFISRTITALFIILSSVNPSSIVQAETSNPVSESDSPNPSGVEVEYAPDQWALLTEPIPPSLETVAGQASVNTPIPEPVSAPVQPPAPSLFKKFTKILTSSFTVSPTRQTGSLLSSITGFFTDLFTNKPAVPETMIPIKQSNSSRDEAIDNGSNENSNSSTDDSAEHSVSNTQSSSSKSSVKGGKAGTRAVSNSSPSATYNLPPKTYNLIPSITRSEVLNLIQQSKDNNQSLLNSLITVAKENSLSLNQSVSDLEKKISALQANTQRQLDKPGSTVSRTDADIQNVTNASITGATITTSSFSGTTGTFSGNFSGTTGSFSGLLTLNANLLMSASSYLNFGTTEGTTGYGFRDNGGTIQIKNSAGSWSNVPTSGTAQWTTNSNDIYYTTGNIGIGTTSPYAKLSVVGETVSSYFTSTSTTATSTFPYLAVTTRSNLGTVIGGTWNGTAIGDGYLTKSGDWTGTLDTYEASSLLARANHAGTQAVSTLSNYDWTFLNNYGANNLTGSTTMPLWAQGGLNASSTSNFLYASTTAFTISGNSYLGTVSSGVWNGSSIGDAYVDDTITLTNLTQITNRAISDTTGTLTVARGGTGQTSFGQGWLNSDGTTLSASTSPTVAWLTATSTTATSTFAWGLQANALNITSTTATSTFARGIDLAGGCFAINGICVGGAASQWTTAGSNIYYTAGNVGIGTTSPWSLLSLKGSSGAQMTIAQADTNYTQLTVDASGNLTLTPSGSTITIPDDNLKICAGDACQTTATLTGNGNLTVENNIEIGGAYNRTCATGYVWVPGSAKLGTLPGFCVMKYEAKNDGSNNAVSTATDGPYVSIDQPTSLSKCEAIGLGYHLISEPEWMTIAENIATTPINDLESTAGLQLATGHSDNAPASALAATAGAEPVVTGCNLSAPLSSNAYSSTCQLRGTTGGGDNDKGYYGTGQTYTGSYTSGGSNDSQLRTHVLSNGNVIWDFAGNVWEWTDAYINGTADRMSVAADSWQEWSAVTDYNNLNYARPQNPAWSSTNGIGKVYVAATAGQRGFWRGGSWGGGSGAGVFLLYLERAPSDVQASVGFRCSR